MKPKLLFLILITFVGIPTYAQQIVFTPQWTPQSQFAGYYVAQEMGYFEGAGLAVEIVQPPEDGAEVLVASGKAQFGVSFQDSMAAALSGDNALPISAVAAVN